MVSTGIIRRVDDLGRVVIPRDIRHRMKIREGEPLEIFIDGKDTVCFHKYETNLCSAVDQLKDQIETYCDLSDKDQKKIKILLDEVRELVKGEE